MAITSSSRANTVTGEHLSELIIEDSASLAAMVAMIEEKVEAHGGSAVAAAFADGKDQFSSAAEAAEELALRVGAQDVASAEDISAARRVIARLTEAYCWVEAALPEGESLESKPELQLGSLI